MYRILIIAFISLLIYAALNGNSTEAEAVHQSIDRTLNNLFDFN